MPALITELKRLGAGDVVVVCGGVIPAPDYAFLEQHGVAAVFGPGTRDPEPRARRLLELIDKQSRHLRACA